MQSALSVGNRTTFSNIWQKLLNVWEENLNRSFVPRIFYQQLGNKILRLVRNDVEDLVIKVPVSSSDVGQCFIVVVSKERR